MKTIIFLWIIVTTCSCSQRKPYSDYIDDGGFAFYIVNKVEIKDAVIGIINNWDYVFSYSTFEKYCKGASDSTFLARNDVYQLMITPQFSPCEFGTHEPHQTSKNIITLFIEA